jgi:hypothetical protein
LSGLRRAQGEVILRRNRQFESTPGSFGASENANDSAIFGEGTKGVLSQVLSHKGRTEDNGWCDVLQVTGAIRGSRYIRAVAQQRPAGWLTSGEENCGMYLLGQAGRTFAPGYGEQWIKALEAGIDIMPNPLKKGHFCLEMAQCSLSTLDAFCLLGDEEVSPGRTLKRSNIRFCEDDEPTAPSAMRQ